MAERTVDLSDLLRAGEVQRTASPGATDPEALLARVRTAVRVARRRRVALAVGVAAAVTVLVGGVATWAPRPPAQPAAPGPAPSTSSVAAPTAVPDPVPTTVLTPTADAPDPLVDVTGLPPAGPADLHDAPPGSVLALWTPRPLSAVVDGAGPQEVHVVLVTPDGDVRHVVRAPDHAVTVTSWDRAAATAVVRTALGGGQTTSPVVDLLTGRTVGTGDDMWSDFPHSPDGRTVADVLGAQVRLTTGDDERLLDLPSRWCSVLGWSDATHLLVTCTARAPRGTVAQEADGPTVALLDVVTGETESRALRTGEVVPVGFPGARTDDGSMVVAVDVVGRDGDGDGSCTTRLGWFDGLSGTALPPVPAARLLHPGIVAAAGSVLVAGQTACGAELTPSGLWALDLASGRVDVLLAPGADRDVPAGLISWTTWG